MTPAATKVLNHLKVHGSITAVEAQAVYRIFDLAGRVMEIRNTLAAAKSENAVKSVYRKDPEGRRYVRYTWTTAIPARVDTAAA